MKIVHKKVAQITSTLYLEDGGEMEVGDRLLQILFKENIHRMQSKMPTLDIEGYVKQYRKKIESYDRNTIMEDDLLAILLDSNRDDTGRPLLDVDEVLNNWMKKMKNH
jgi:hypothetical protein